MQLMWQLFESYWLILAIIYYLILVFDYLLTKMVADELGFDPLEL